MRILSYVLTLASSRMGTMALMGSLIFSPSASVPMARSWNREYGFVIWQPWIHISSVCESISFVITDGLWNQCVNDLWFPHPALFSSLISFLSFPPMFPFWSPSLVSLPSALFISSCLSPALSPVRRGTVCPLFPGSASYSPQPAADEWSTEKQGTNRESGYTLTHTGKITQTHINTHTLLSSFWYWGIFFSIWDRSLIVVCWNKIKRSKCDDVSFRSYNELGNKFNDNRTKICWTLVSWQNNQLATPLSTLVLRVNVHRWETEMAQNIM